MIDAMLDGSSFSGAPRPADAAGAPARRTAAATVAHRTVLERRASAPTL